MFDLAGVARLREYAKGDTVLPILDTARRHRRLRGDGAPPQVTDNVAYAVVHTEPPSIFLADDIDVLHRLALEVVARTDRRAGRRCRLDL